MYRKFFRMLPAVSTIVQQRTYPKPNGIDSEKALPVYLTDTSPTRPPKTSMTGTIFNSVPSGFAYYAMQVTRYLSTLPKPFLFNLTKCEPILSWQDDPWATFLRNLKSSVTSRYPIIKPIKVFISYAWEDGSTEEGRQANASLQRKLLQLYNDLKASGCKKVFFDATGMRGYFRWCMDQLLEYDVILVICTPRLVKRLAEVDSNVSYEADLTKQVIAKFKQTRLSASDPKNRYPVIGLLLSDSFDKAVPSFLRDGAGIAAKQGTMVLDFQHMENPINYAHSMAGTISPLGLLPSIYGFSDDDPDYIKLMADYHSKVHNLPVTVYDFSHQKHVKLPELMERFKHYPVQNISGLGDLGNIQLVLNYIQETYLTPSPSSYTFCHWLNANNKADLLLSFQNLARLLGIPFIEGLLEKELSQRIYQHLRIHQTKSLLIFDGVRDYADIKDVIPSLIDPKQHIMIVNQKDGELGLSHSEKLKMFTVNEAVNYLLINSSGHASHEEAKALAAELHNFPLALGQAVAYMKATNTTISTYLTLYQKRYRELFPEGSIEVSSYRILKTTWSLMIDK